MPTKPWTPLAAFLRSAAIVALSAFFGGLVLPMATNGALPIDWAHWRTVLGVATSAAVVAELAWIRTHIAQAKAALDAAEKKDAGFVRVEILALILLVACGAGAVTARQTADVTGYGGAQQLCIQVYTAKSDIDRCRDMIKNVFCADGGSLAADEACGHVTLSDGGKP